MDQDIRQATAATNPCRVSALFMACVALVRLGQARTRDPQQRLYVVRVVSLQLAFCCNPAGVHPQAPVRVYVGTLSP